LPKDFWGILALFVREWPFEEKKYDRIQISAWNATFLKVRIFRKILSKVLSSAPIFPVLPKKGASRQEGALKIHFTE
jgi:hypothetical protein